jgi:hypothetical protein
MRDNVKESFVQSGHMARKMPKRVRCFYVLKYRNQVIKVLEAIPETKSPKERE